MGAKKGRIRALALCVFRHPERTGPNNAPVFLIGRGHDPSTDETFYRPIGGGIDFGETSHQTVVREIREEIDAQVSALRLLGTLENVFTYDGKDCHELILMYDGVFDDASVYERNPIPIIDDAPSVAVWKSLSDFRGLGGDDILYPDGLDELLSRHWLRDY